MKKIHLGCGGKIIEGWDNYDIEVDISKRLPFEDNSASRIFAEHVIEHVTHKQAWNFLEECRRVLVVGGVVRIALPDVQRMWDRMTDEYRAAVQKDVGGDGSAKAAIRAAIFDHGHQGAWTGSLLRTIMEAIGFKAKSVAMGQSTFFDLVGVEQHGKTVGESVSRVETSVVEGVKLA